MEPAPPANGTGFVDGSSTQGNVSFIYSLPVHVREFIAGGAAGAFAKFSVASLERVKTLLQTRTEGFNSVGVYPSLKKLLKHEVVQGPYKGNGASVLQIVPYAAIHFMAFERCRYWLLNSNPSFGAGPFIDLLAGSAAGGTAVLCTYPLDLARTKLAYQVEGNTQSFRTGMSSIHSQPAYHAIQDILRKVYKEDGVRALYRGVAVAGFLGQTFTYPLNVVRRQMQVESLREGGARYKDTMEGLITIFHNQGWRQLFAGLSVYYMKVVPSVAIGFTVYDVMKYWLRVPSQQKS